MYTFFSIPLQPWGGKKYELHAKCIAVVELFFSAAPHGGMKWASISCGT